MCLKDSGSGCGGWKTIAAPRTLLDPQRRFARDERCDSRHGCRECLRSCRPCSVRLSPPCAHARASSWRSSSCGSSSPCSSATSLDRLFARSTAVRRRDSVRCCTVAWGWRLDVTRPPQACSAGWSTVFVRNWCYRLPGSQDPRCKHSPGACSLRLSGGRANRRIRAHREELRELHRAHARERATLNDTQREPDLVRRGDDRRKRPRRVQQLWVPACC